MTVVVSRPFTRLISYNLSHRVTTVCCRANVFVILIAGWYSWEFCDSRIHKWMTLKDPDLLSARDKNRHVVRSACGSATACCCRTSLTHVSELQAEVKLICVRRCSRLRKKLNQLHRDCATERTQDCTRLC
jgi:hypothetical protein